MDIQKISHMILEKMINSRIKDQKYLFDVMRDYSNKYLYLPLCLDLKQYFAECADINIDGYITFRMRIYHYELDQYFSNLLRRVAIQKQYDEFIYSMQQYVKQSKSNEGIVYLTYVEDGAYDIFNEAGDSLIDEAKAYYIEEFGQCEENQADYIFHYLLKLMPQFMYISGSKRTSFLQTVSLIFQERLSYSKF